MPRHGGDLHRLAAANEGECWPGCDSPWAWQLAPRVSISGPSIHGSGRWGQVLNVEEAYCSSSHALICSLFSGVHANGSC